MPSDWSSWFSSTYWSSSTSTNTYQLIYEFIGDMFEEDEPKKHLGFADYLEEK